MGIIALYRLRANTGYWLYPVYSVVGEIKVKVTMVEDHHLLAGLDCFNEEQRNLVERSCAALGILLSNVFAALERTLQDGMVEAEGEERVFLAHSLGQLAIDKSTVEQVTIRSVLLAYLELVVDGQEMIQGHLQQIEADLQDELDLMEIYQAEDVVNEYINRNRPLLIYISAQLHSLFEINTSQIPCNPLAPNVLIYGFICGLRSVSLDPVLKYELFKAFEQEFLVQLPSLLNNIINRLEQENLNVSTGIAFDESNAGPVCSVFDKETLTGLSDVQEALDKLIKELEGCSVTSPMQNLLERAQEDSRESALHSLSLAYKVIAMDKPAASHRSSVCSEADYITKCRQQVIGLLNDTFSDVRMPEMLRDFYGNVWKEVLFSVYTCAEGDSDLFGKKLEEIESIQKQLLDSLVPVKSVEEGTALGQEVPSLIRALRHELECADIPNATISQFLGQLKPMHLQNLQQKLNVEEFVEWMPLMDSEESSPAQEGDEYLHVEKLEVLFSALSRVA